ncbi:MAG: hypothetical protein M3O95_01480, partial [Candidatus Dormibacteraeota bacterium]|jgi:Glycosyl hydrolase family 26|nr:hypothetical protein [Candidatus Dormibacteraeota bacterium]
MRRTLYLLVAAVALLVSTPAAGAQAISYGEWNPGWQTGGSVNNSVISAREQDMGHPLDIIHWYAGPGEGYSGYEHIMVDNALMLKRIPFVSWALPVGFSDNALLDDWAAGIKANAPQQVYIRLFWEFNDPPSDTNGSWGVCHSRRGPEQLVQSWRSIVDRFRADGATNVKWVWNPDGTMGSQMYGDDCGSMAAAYPGDAYVDFRGFDDYAYDTKAQYDALNTQTGSSKPMLLGEIGATDHDGPGGAKWIQSLGALLDSGSVPQLLGIVYFNEKTQALSSNPETHAALKALLKQASATPAAGTPQPTGTPQRTSKPQSGSCSGPLSFSSP